jgi:aminoglycoside phosphotransferase (APT) family kinase protein
VTGFDLTVDETLVAGLLADQFPEWCHLPLKRIKSAGTGNATYRLGDQKAVRLPLVSWAADFIKKEVLWPPKLQLRHAGGQEESMGRRPRMEPWP